VLYTGCCNKETELPKASNYIRNINHPSRVAVNELFKGIYRLIDTPMSFGEVPAINSRIYSQINISDIHKQNLKNIYSQFTSILGFDVFNKIITKTAMFPMERFPFALEETLP